MAHLFLVRHGQSTYNELGLWTGHTDVDLTERGHDEARQAARAIAQVPIHIVHTSPLKRTHQTFHSIREALGQPELQHQSYSALLERHYGIHQGKNKWQVQEEIGDEAFQAIRRGWDVAIPEGETLKDVHARVVPHYETLIRPELASGKNVLVVSHGNTLRALVKHLDGIAEALVASLEIVTGEVYQYQIDPSGLVAGKTIHATQLVAA